MTFLIQGLPILKRIEYFRKMAKLSSLLNSIRYYSGVSGKIKGQKYVLTKYFQGEPKKSDFKIVEEELPELKDGGKLRM